MLAATQALFDSRTAPADIQAANQFLLHYFDQKNCFFESLQFLIENRSSEGISNNRGSESLHIRQFYLTTLYNKIRKHWNQQLNDEEKKQFVQSIAQFVISLLPELREALEREDQSLKLYGELAIRALSASVLRSPECLGSYFALVDQCFENASFLFIGIKILNFLFEEFQDLDINRRAKGLLEEELKPQFQQRLPTVAGIISSTSNLSPVHRSLLLQYLQRTLQLQGMSSIASVRDLYPQCIQFVLQHLFALDTASHHCLAVAHSLVLDIIVSQEYPVQDANEKIRQDIIAFLLDQSASFLQSYPIQSSSSSSSSQFLVTHELLKTFMVLILRELHSLDQSNPSLKSQMLMSLFEKIFIIINFPNRKFLLLSFDFWFEFQETLASLVEEDGWKTHSLPFNPSLIMRSLFECLFRHSLYPLDRSSSGHSWADLANDFVMDDEVEEDFDALRDRSLGIEDLFQLCFDYAASDCFTFFRSSSQSLMSSIAANGFGPAAWQMLDSILFLTICTMENLKGQLSAPQLAELLFPLAMAAFQCYDSLCSTSSSLPGLERYSQRLIQLLAHFIGASSSLLTATSPHTEIDATLRHQLFLNSWKMCLTTIFSNNISSEYEDSRKICSQILTKLFLQGRTELASPNHRDEFRGGIAFFTSAYPHIVLKAAERFVGQTIESFTAVCLAVADEKESGDLLVMLSQPILDGLQLLNSVPLQQWPRGHYLLAKAVHNHCAHLLEPFLSIRDAQQSSLPALSFVHWFFAQVFPKANSLAHQYFQTSYQQELALEALLVIDSVFHFFSQSLPLLSWATIPPFPPLADPEKVIRANWRNHRQEILQQLNHLLTTVNSAVQTKKSLSLALSHSRIFIGCLDDFLEVFLKVESSFPVTHIEEVMDGERSLYRQTFLSSIQTIGTLLLAILSEFPPVNRQLSCETDAFRAYFILMEKLLGKPQQRELLVGLQVLPSLLSISISLLQCSLDRESLTSTCYCVQLVYQIQDFRASFEASLWQESALFVSPLLRGLFLQLSLPQPHATAVTILGDCLSAVVCTMYVALSEQQANEILQAAFLEGSVLPSLMRDKTREGEEDRERQERELVLTNSLNLMKRMSLEKNRRFKAFINDFYKICTGEETVDALAAYSDSGM